MGPQLVFSSSATGAPRGVRTSLIGTSWRKQLLINDFTTATVRFPINNLKNDILHIYISNNNHNVYRIIFFIYPTAVGHSCQPDESGLRMNGMLFREVNRTVFQRFYVTTTHRFPQHMDGNMSVFPCLPLDDKGQFIDTHFLKIT